MCGRYYSLFDKEQAAEYLSLPPHRDGVGPIAPNYNVAPGDFQPVIRRRDSAALLPRSFLSQMPSIGKTIGTQLNT
jgi:putative SOS response-associated peptidase YedK